MKYESNYKLIPLEQYTKYTKVYKSIQNSVAILLEYICVSNLLKAYIVISKLYRMELHHTSASVVGSPSRARERWSRASSRWSGFSSSWGPSWRPWTSGPPCSWSPRSNCRGCNRFKSRRKNEDRYFLDVKPNTLVVDTGQNDIKRFNPFGYSVILQEDPDVPHNEAAETAKS